MVAIFRGDQIFMDFVRFLIHSNYEFYIQVIYVIVNVMTPCFHRPSLLSRSLMGQCTGNIHGV